MKFIKNKKIIALVSILGMIFTSCAPSQKAIDNILPDSNRRMYSIADLIPYTYKELRNAQALYGIELNDFFTKNTTTPAEASRVTREEKMDFYKDLCYRASNYRLLRQRLAMYIEDEYTSASQKEAERQKEYDEYYKLPNAKGGSTLKQYNNGKLQGMPLVSIRVDLSTATMSDIDALYSEAVCEIYKPIVIEESKYKTLKFGDILDIEIPATNSTINCKSLKKVTCTYVATDSFTYANEGGETEYIFVAGHDGLNDDCRRLLDYYGKTLEVYVESKPLQFMKYARVARANEIQRLMTSIVNDSLVSYDFDKIAVRALGGGYLTYEYKDYVYANSISTNLKGYITSLYYYDNQRIDNEYYDSLD